MKTLNFGPMLNAYPDSVGGDLKGLIQILQQPQLANTFSSFYILPSVFNSDLDRGFSVLDYGLNDLTATQADLEQLKALGLDLKLDFVLNHLSVLSPQFQDMIEKGHESVYKDFFINWNDFWQGYGEMTSQGFIQPDATCLDKMFFRKPGLPILMVRFPDGSDQPYWNTFYNEVQYPRLIPSDMIRWTDLKYWAADVISSRVNQALDAGVAPSDIDFTGFEAHKEQIVSYLETNRRYMGQMDLNLKSPLVWEFYEDTLAKLAGYGAKIVRLDAFAYAPKAPGEKNFMNEPETWELLDKIKQMAAAHGLSVLPEIHTSYAEKSHEIIADKGYLTYDFFLPGLLIDALESGESEHLAAWAQDIIDKDMKVVNMLGCHDGIPLLDLKGMLSEERIAELIHVVVGRGGYVKNLHGKKNMYYQVNATYYSALGEDDRKMLLARALQLFMPGKPQVWYLDLFLGKNDHEAVARAGEGGHKEINRTNITLEQALAMLDNPTIQEQLRLLQFRQTNPAFDSEANVSVEHDGNMITLTWAYDGYTAVLTADLVALSYHIVARDASGEVVAEF
ncbi:hypothetical protein I4Q36_09950 [Tuanshanicoccus lijuaniae]|uniref:alpha-amylase family glycosyl hydrolase n=1 Tax=Aerococcaceae bacterium zg-1292 TaxID=2774330 RepID=UPI0019378A97|nr:glycosidase [Aerococcaceae bacterium zg-1292]QQA37068.1 hypothetical protein I4Q36_09950 [Aerococcaceae bacterium zg-1292]